MKAKDLAQTFTLYTINTINNYFMFVFYKTPVFQIDAP